MTARTQPATPPDKKKTSQGAIAQLGERLPCTQEVGGSIPPGSTNFARMLLLITKVLNERHSVFSSVNLKEIFFKFVIAL